MDAFLSGLVAGYGIAVPVGAISVLIVQVGIRCGFKCALAAGAGAATADLIYATLAVIGGAALAQAVETIGDPLRMLSAAVLIVIALVGLARVRKPIEEVGFSEPDTAELAVTYARFLGLTIINPMTIVYFAAVVVGLGLATDLSPGAGFVFVVAAALASLSWQALIAAVGGFAGSRLTTRAQRVAIIAGNLMVLGLAGAILLR